MTNETAAAPALTLADYIQILRRRKWVVIQAIIIAPLVAFLFSTTQPAVYQATAGVVLSQQDLAGQVTGIQSTSGFQDPTRFAQTQAELARVPEVARRAVAGAHVRGFGANALLGASTVVPMSSADVLQFTVTNGDPIAARRLATAYATAFTDYRTELDTSAIEQARGQLLQRLRQLKASGQGGTALYSGLLEKEQQLRTLKLLQTSNSVVHAAAGAGQIAPRPKRNALLALILGAVLGVSIAFAWEALDRRVRTSAEIERAIPAPVLGRLSAPPRNLRTRGLTMLDDPLGSGAEAFRRLRANVEFANLDRRAQALMVSSAVQREGKSTTAANLAVAFAESGQRVVLVDLDLRRPAVGTLLGVGRRAGVAEVVRREVDLQSALAPVSVETVSTATGYSGAVERNGSGSTSKFVLNVLTAGLTLPLDPSQVISSAAFDKMFEDLRAHADLLIVDSPPLLAVAETVALSLRVDALLIVSRLGVVQRAALGEVARLLKNSPTPALGLIVTGASDETLSGYGAYGYYGAKRPTAARRVNR